MPALIQAFSRKEIATVVAETLSSFGTDAQSAIPQLLRFASQIDSDSYTDFDVVESALEHIGPPAHADIDRICSLLDHGVIRDKPLEPTANPLVAAEKLLTSQKFQSLPQNDWNDAVSNIRNQAFALLRLTKGPENDDSKIDNRAWKLQVNSEYGLSVWDVDKQQFVLPSKNK